MAATVTKRWARATGQVYTYKYVGRDGMPVLTKKPSKDPSLRFVSKTLVNLDYSEISASDIVTPIRSEEVDGVMQTLATFKCRYTVRIALPKWLQKLFKEYVISDAYSFKLEGGKKVSVRQTEELKRLRSVMEELLPDGFEIAERGYQPQSGFIIVQKTDLNTQYAHATLKYYGRLAYTSVRKYQKKVLKGALENGYAFPERFRWQRNLLAQL